MPQKVAVTGAPDRFWVTVPSVPWIVPVTVPSDSIRNGSAGLFGPETIVSGYVCCWYPTASITIDHVPVFRMYGVPCR